MQKITPFLWFDDKAEEAAKFYVSIFKNSRIGGTARYGEAGAKASGRPIGSVMTVAFQLDGQEFVALNGGPRGGTKHAFSAVYQDIVPDERIVYSYDMHLDDAKISASLTTVEFKAAGAGTRLAFTDPDVFLDAFEDPGARGREGGTRDLLDKLEKELAG